MGEEDGNLDNGVDLEILHDILGHVPLTRPRRVAIRKVYMLPGFRSFVRSATGTFFRSHSTASCNMKLSYISLTLSVVFVRALPTQEPSDPLRGSESLLGYDPSNPVPKTPSTVIPPSEFELAPGQSEDAKLGLYIDLSDVKNPQPIRGGSTGPTDPGPRYTT
jgi:hypothetical protein